MAKGNHKSGNHSLRSGRSQALHVAKQLAAHGSARHGGGRDSGTVKAVGSERILKNDLTGAACWAAARGESLASMTPALATEYLLHRSEAVRQAQLNSDRQSLNKLLALNGAGEKLPVVRSTLPAIQHNKHYTDAQVSAIIERVAARNEPAALSIRILAETGCRAHEIHSLQRADSGGGHAADFRSWRDDLFAGRTGTGSVTFITEGKGGLKRTLLLNSQTAAALERYRTAPVTCTDRGVHYHDKVFSIPGGNALSAVFGRASKAVLGWSDGAHALRHAYVERRMVTLTEQLNYRYSDAKLLISQELGHFRPELLAFYGFP